jgi:hypothetical protein
VFCPPIPYMAVHGATNALPATQAKPAKPAQGEPREDQPPRQYAAKDAADDICKSLGIEG